MVFYIHLVKNFNLDILDFRILTSNESGYDHEVYNEIILTGVEGGLKK